MATNVHFNNFKQTSEQDLIEDLIVESIKMYGIDILYMPRKLIDRDEVFQEDRLARFNQALECEMYIKSVDGFDGEGTFLSKFGLEIRDQVTLTVAIRSFEENVLNETNEIDQLGQSFTRAREGDLIYLPLNNKLFEIKFVEHESVFYQMGALQMYDLTCELFEYSSERFSTGYPEIDGIEEAYSRDANNFVVATPNNDIYEVGGADLIDFTERNPFGDAEY